MTLSRVQAFAKIVETESFTLAARALGTSKSGVSRALQELEEELGVRLLHRTTRKLSLTQTGKAYFDGIRGALAHIEESGRIARGEAQTPHGVVRVAAPDLGSLLLPAIVRDFTARFPQVRVELSLSARLVDLVEEGFDLAVRSGRLKSSSLISRRVGELSSGVYASAAYLQSRGRPQSVSELSSHDCIVIRRPEAAEGAGATWRLRTGERWDSVAVHGPLAVDDMMAAWEAVRLGMGLGLLPSLSGLTDGLDNVLPVTSSAPAAINLVWPSRRHEPARVVLFRDFLLSRLREEIRRSGQRSAAGGRR
jgi:DNA-binding transcriptional LysR family regulator